MEQFLRRHSDLIARLHRLAQCDRWNVSREQFAEALARSVEHRFRGSDPGSHEMARYVESLHLADLALACGCALGSEAAWEHFVGGFRPRLRAAAVAIAGATGRDLADSLYAELYGLEERDGRRRSLFEYFHGRSTLITWLRAVLAQRHIDSVRSSGKTEPLGEHDPAPPAGGRGEVADPAVPRYLGLLKEALTASLAALEPRDRLRLSYYYLQELTLAQIGRLMGEHEATVSRKLERTRRRLRHDIEARLRADARLSDAQIQLCFERAIDEWPFDLTAKLGEMLINESTGQRLKE